MRLDSAFELAQGIYNRLSEVEGVDIVLCPPFVYLASVESVRRHPLMPKDVPVHGLIICPETGQLEVLADGYADSKPTPAF